MGRILRNDTVGNLQPGVAEIEVLIEIPENVKALSYSDNRQIFILNELLSSECPVFLPDVIVDNKKLGPGRHSNGRQQAHVHQVYVIPFIFQDRLVLLPCGRILVVNVNYICAAGHHNDHRHCNHKKR